jgi:photosystem II stability/assembly factor-like uncharacterized protein
MNTEKVWLALVILIAILVGSNGLMYLMARGSRGFHIDWKSEDDDWEKLNERVKALKPPGKDE